MQDRVRSACLFQHLRPAGHVHHQRIHPPEQAIAEGPKLSWRTLAAESLEPANGVADVRREEGEAEIFAVVADLGQQRVSGAAPVQLGDEVRRRADANLVGLAL